MAKSKTIATPTGVLRWGRLFAPNDRGNYEAAVLFPKGTDLSELRAVVDEVVKEVCGGKPPKNLVLPFKDQGSKTDDEGRLYDGFEEGAEYISAKSKYAPDVRYPDLRKMPEEEAAGIWDGCLVKLAVSAYSWEHTGKKGVSFNLSAVQLISTGERVGGSGDTGASVFTAVEPAAAEDMLG